MTEHDFRRVSPFRHLRIIKCLASPRSFSQLTASFIAFRRQGIHPMLLSTCFSKKTSFIPCSIVNDQTPLRGPGSSPIRTGDLTSPLLTDLTPLPCRKIRSLMVGLERLELSTSRLSGVRSNHLSYRPARIFFSMSRRSSKVNSEWYFFSLKEVIQPQVPLRLPCYDFTPIIGPTVDGCLYC